MRSVSFRILYIPLTFSFKIFHILSAEDTKNPAKRSLLSRTRLIYLRWRRRGDARTPVWSIRPDQEAKIASRIIYTVHHESAGRYAIYGNYEKSITNVSLYNKIGFSHGYWTRRERDASQRLCSRSVIFKRYDARPVRKKFLKLEDYFVIHLWQGILFVCWIDIRYVWTRFTNSTKMKVMKHKKHRYYSSIMSQL